MSICKCCGQPMPRKAVPKEQGALALKDTRWDKEREDGFISGSTWDANWIPGGPHEFPEQVGKCAAWLQGWHAGLELRLKTNKRFRTWWERNHDGGRSPRLLRYEEPVS
jgi:hypothetical protein